MTHLRIDLKQQYPRDIAPLIQRAISEHKNLCMSCSNTRSPVGYVSLTIPTKLRLRKAL